MILVNMTSIFFKNKKTNKKSYWLIFIMVPKAGLEPARGLNLAGF